MMLKQRITSALQNTVTYVMVSLSLVRVYTQNEPVLVRTVLGIIAAVAAKEGLQLNVDSMMEFLALLTAVGAGTSLATRRKVMPTVKVARRESYRSAISEPVIPRRDDA